MTIHTDVAIVGAGPYGLSIAAELQQRNIDFRIIGRTMQSWISQMPKGMLLKSPGFSSSLHDPSGSFTMRCFCLERNIPYADIDRPIPLEVFAAYGIAFQQRFVPQLEQDKLVSLERHRNCFTLQLEGDRIFSARNVILATGLDYFRQMPAPMRRLPSPLSSHSADHHDLARFKNREVAVIGGGASAIDLAVLLHEAGAVVELIVRKEELDFGKPWLGSSRSLWRRMREPMSGIGLGWRNRLFTNFPALYRHLPDETRLRTARTHLGPSGGWFMKERAAVVPTRLGCKLECASASGDRVRLQLIDANGRKQCLSVDHVIAATGYYMDIRRLPFLHDDISQQLQVVSGSPRLSAHFESSVPGLYFAGPIAAASFGPVMRFVAGSGFTACRIGRHLSRHLAGLAVADASRTTPQPAVELES